MFQLYNMSVELCVCVCVCVCVCLCSPIVMAQRRRDRGKKILPEENTMDEIQQDIEGKIFYWMFLL